jgi:hypothetical protein
VNQIYDIAIKELEERKEDMRPSDVILFSEPLRSALNFVIRLGRFSLTEFVENSPSHGMKRSALQTCLWNATFLQSRAFPMPKKHSTKSRLTAMTRPLTRPPSDLWKKID